MKSFGPKKFQIPCTDKKSVILAIFQTGPGWPFPVSTALKNPLPDPSLAEFQNFFLLLVPMNSYQSWTSKLERANSFSVQSGKIPM